MTDKKTNPFDTLSDAIQAFKTAFMDGMQPILGNRIIMWGVVISAYVGLALLIADAMGVLWK